MFKVRMPATRWQAALIHLGISAVLYVVLLYLIVFHWYPQPYFAVDGGWQGVQLITGVDLVLGPFLTVMIYRRGKPGLKFDLTLIALFQAVAMAWGIWLVYGERTAAVVFGGTNFQTLSIEQVREAGETAVRLVDESADHPPYFIVRLPKHHKDRIALFTETLRAGVPLSKLGDRYERPGPDNRTAPFEFAVDIEARVKDFDDDREALDAFLATHGGQASDYAFVPLSARYAYLLLALDRQNARVVGALNIRPRASTESRDAAHSSTPAVNAKPEPPTTGTGQR